MIACDACGLRCDTPRATTQTQQKCTRCQHAQEGQNSHRHSATDQLWYAPNPVLWPAPILSPLRSGLVRTTP